MPTSQDRVLSSVFFVFHPLLKREPIYRMDLICGMSDLQKKAVFRKSIET